MQQLAIPVAVQLLLSTARPVLAAQPQEQIKKALDAVALVLKDPSRQGPDKQAERRQRVRQIILDAPPPHDVVLSSGEGWPLAPAAVTTSWHVSNNFVTVWRRDPSNSPLHIQTPAAHGLMQPSIWG
jgi:hypothetical protein